MGYVAVIAMLVCALAAVLAAFATDHDDARDAWDEVQLKFSQEG